MDEPSEQGPRTPRGADESTVRLGASDTPTVRLSSSGPKANEIPDPTSALLRAEDGGPLRIGRFAVISVIGRGGMGIVFSAFDEELDRRVAIKLVRRQLDDELRYRERTLREAQALARLSHPNVVHVYEVGEHAGQVFVAMEFVHGQTLRQWLAERPREWEEVLGIFIQAGRGLAAAHSAGLVHRDFKPQNVLVGRDGRARVADFGLASRSDGEVTPPESSVRLRRDRSTLDLLSVELTATGMTLGTPAYMSPEQHERGAIDARSDQFSFCVALYEGLYGSRPFAGLSTKDLAAAAVLGKIEEPPQGTRVPSEVRRAILRGLQPSPADRWPSMEALLAQLEKRPGRVRRRLLTSVGAGLGAAAVAFTIFSAWPGGQRTCGGGAALRSAAWGPEQRRAVEGAILGSGVAYAADTWSRVDEALGRYIGAWEATYREGCETHQRGEISDELLDRSVACLQQRRREFSALVGVLARADAGAVPRAVEAVGQLRPPAACGDVEALASAVAVAVDPAQAEAVDRERDALAGARALVDAAFPRLAEVELAGVVERVRALAYPPLVVEALLIEGRLRKKLGEPAAAEVSLVEAYQRAEVIAAEHERIEITAELVEVVGYHLARPGEAAVWGTVGEAAARRIGAADPALARLDNALGMVLAAQGRHAEARERYGAALAIQERSGAKPGAEAARALNNLGQLSYADGDLDEAARRYQQALTIYEAALGSGHPDLGGPLNNLGNVEVTRARGATKAEAAAHYEGGRRYYEKALEVYENAYGAGHLLLAFPLLNLGDVDFLQEHYVAAEARYARALAIREANYAADHPLLVTPLSNLGLVALELGDAARARPLLERALAIRERSASPPAELAETRFALARALWLTAGADEAAARERARGLAEAARAGFAGEAGYGDDVREIDGWLAEHPAAPIASGRGRR